MFLETVPASVKLAGYGSLLVTADNIAGLILVLIVFLNPFSPLF